MAAKLRIATVNLENLDNEAGEGLSSLLRCIEVMRPQLMRLQADILCLQEGPAAVGAQEGAQKPWWRRVFGG